MVLEEKKELTDQWFTELQNDYLSIQLKIKEQLFSGNSDFQKIDIYETYDHGKLLTLDDKVMLTERDEFIYHEMLSHVSLFTHANPKKVLIIGGGDGGALREVVKHDIVETAHLCELDEVVVQKCKEFFPFFNETWDMPKVEIFYQDGFHFLKENPNTYDVILVDSTDPIGEAEKLFDLPFYKLCHQALSHNGILTVQSESPFYNASLISEMKKKFASLFPITRLYTAAVPTYPSGFWSFMMGSKIYDPEFHLRQQDYDSCHCNFQYYNDGIHKASFKLPSYLKNY